eukprot:GHVQ01016658.1.p1 GENE.GHVQ01016658.1~~GHVQ01016658.1.p1  ORF type:complete len:379 (+),score=39.60 GHVQ01016658.1:460-1596(+)
MSRHNSVVVFDEPIESHTSLSSRSSHSSAYARPSTDSSYVLRSAPDTSSEWCLLPDCSVMQHSVRQPLASPTTSQSDFLSGFLAHPSLLKNAEILHTRVDPPPSPVSLSSSAFLSNSEISSCLTPCLSRVGSANLSTPIPDFRAVSTLYANCYSRSSERSCQHKITNTARSVRPLTGTTGRSTASSMPPTAKPCCTDECPLSPFLTSTSSTPHYTTPRPRLQSFLPCPRPAPHQPPLPLKLKGHPIFPRSPSPSPTTLPCTLLRPVTSPSIRQRTASVISQQGPSATRARCSTTRRCHKKCLRTHHSLSSNDCLPSPVTPRQLSLEEVLPQQMRRPTLETKTKAMKKAIGILGDMNGEEMYLKFVKTGGSMMPAAVII